MISHLLEPLESRIAPATINLTSITPDTTEDALEGMARFRVALTEAVGSEVKVQFTTSGGTAVSDSDFGLTAGTLIFAPGETEKFINVPILADGTFEFDENFFLSVTGIETTDTSVKLGDSLVNHTIKNDDAMPVISISDAQVVEGNAGNSTTVELVFLAHLSAASGVTTTVIANTFDGLSQSATAGTDYTALKDIAITFLPGETTKEIRVKINSDTRDDLFDQETLRLVLSLPQNATLAPDAEAIGTINDDDAEPTISVSATSKAEGGANVVGSMGFIVSLSNESDKTISVQYSTLDGTAKVADGDYIPTTGTVIFSPGVRQQTVSIPILGDTTFEGNETFSLRLDSPTNATIAQAEAIGTILDDDGVPLISVSDATVVEGSATPQLRFKVSLNHASTQTVMVDLELGNGTATLGTDYTFTSPLTVTFAPGETLKEIVVDVTPDAIAELDETVILNAVRPSNATITDGQGIGTIITDEAVVTISDASVNEGGNLVFTVMLVGSGASTENPVRVNFSTENLTALAAIAGNNNIKGDYTANSGELVFTSNGSKTITVATLQDNRAEVDETMRVNLTTAVGGPALLKSSATGTIRNDDGLPRFIVPATTTITEGDSGMKELKITVSLGGTTNFDQPISVDFRTVPGTAGTDDFVSQTGTVIFQPGETSKQITILVNGDNEGEGNETFSVELFNPAVGTLSTPSSTTVTIVEDDAYLQVVNLEANGELSEGATNRMMRFRVNFVNPGNEIIDFPITFDYNTLDLGTGVAFAKAGLDYTATSGMGTIERGQTFFDITVPYANDSINEAKENFGLKISDTNGIGFAPAGAEGTIVDNDTLFLQVIGGSVAEGNTGTTQTNFTVQLVTSDGQLATSDQIVAVNYVVGAGSDGATAADNDFVSSLGTLTFSPGTSTLTVPVTIIGDSKGEANETFGLVLSGHSNVSAEARFPQNRIEIRNDDPVLRVAGFTIDEGDGGGEKTANFQVILDNVPTGPFRIEVDITAVNGSAKETDFRLVNPGQTRLVFTEADLVSGTSIIKNVPVFITQDDIAEGNENFFLQLSNEAGATVQGSRSAVGTIDDDDPTLRIKDIRVNEDASTATVTVELVDAPNEEVTVQYATKDGTAVSTGERADYTSASGSLVFSPGSSVRTIEIPLAADARNEADETFTVDFTNIPNGIALDPASGSATVTIVNDDAPPTITVTDITLEADKVEGDVGSDKTYKFKLQLSEASDQPITVKYATLDGDGAAGAIAGQDYVAIGETLITFPANETGPVEITVTVKGDGISEPDEAFFLRFFEATNAMITGGNAQGELRLTANIRNDDAGIRIGDVSIAEGQNGSRNLVFVVTREGDTSGAITFDYETVDGTAISTGTNKDFSALSRTTATINSGATSTQIFVPIFGDTRLENAEDFLVRLTNVTGATILDGEAKGTITNDDAAPSFQISDVTLVEGNSGTSQMVFKVTRQNASDLTTKISFATENVTATAGVDYTALSGELVFAPDVFEQLITIDVLGDAIGENTETFNVKLTVPEGQQATLADATGVGTITNDDAVLRISGPATIREGNSGTTTATYTVTLENGPAVGNVTVDFNTKEITATAGEDFQARLGTLTFAPGETQKTISVPINVNTTVEPDQEYRVQLSNASTNATVVTGEVATVIQDDDVTVSIAKTISIVEGNPADPVPEGGEAPLFVELTISLNKTIDIPVTLGYRTVPIVLTDENGNPRGAEDGTDFIGITGNITFNPGETTKTIKVEVKRDTIRELDEIFDVKLENLVGAEFAKEVVDGTEVTLDTTRVTITNDDAAPKFSILDPLVVTEGGQTSVAFVVRLEGNLLLGEKFRIDAFTQDNTATIAGNDYVDSRATFRFTPEDVTDRMLVVPILNDSIGETMESFFASIILSTDPMDTVGNATIVRSQAEAKIIDNDATITVKSTTVRVSEGAKQVTITLVGNNIDAGGALVDYKTVDDSATAGSDYTAKAMSAFAIQNGDNTITVTILDDEISESNERFFLDLSNALGATILDARATVEIENDESQYSISDAQITEQDGGTQQVNVTISRSGDISQSGSITLNTVDGTAMAVRENFNFGDYQMLKDLVVTFAEGERTKTVPITIVGDTHFESNQTFRALLSNPGNGVVLDGDATITIINDDARPVVTVAPVSVVEGDSGTSQMQFVVRLSGTAEDPATLNFSTANGTATAGVDYMATSGQLTIQPFTTSATIMVPIFGDEFNESDETLTLNLSNPSANISLSDQSAIGTIRNDELRITVANKEVDEADTGTTMMTFDIVLSGAAPAGGVTLKYKTTDDTAKSTGTAIDYQAQSGTITFKEGDTKQSISIPITGDRRIDSFEMERFFLELSDATNATIDTPKAVGTIDDNDEGILVVENLDRIKEGDSGTSTANFTVKLVSKSNTSVELTAENEITFSAKTVDGTAKSNIGEADFLALATTTFKIAAGSSSTTIPITINGDTLFETVETFSISITNAQAGNDAKTGIVGVDEPATDPTGTIRDIRTVSVKNVSVAEGAAGATTDAVFEIKLDGAAEEAIDVQYQTLSVSAIGGTDFVAQNGTLTFAPGQSSKTVTVFVTGDDVAESNETFNLRLTKPTDHLLQNNQDTLDAVGTILTDDTFYKLERSGGPLNHSINEGSPTYNVASNTFANTTQTITYKVIRTGDTSGTGTVTFTTRDGTAISTGANPDYAANSGTISFGANESEKTITITVNRDYDFENEESFILELITPTNGVLDSNKSSTITILDDTSDLAPVLRIEDARANEGDGITFNVSLVTEVSPTRFVEVTNEKNPVTLTFASADGMGANPALAGGANSDYTGVTGSVTFTSGETLKQITVTTLEDVRLENDEVFLMNLSNIIGATALNNKLSATGTIINDEAPIKISFGGDDKGNFSVQEGVTNKTAAIIVRLSGASDSPVSVSYNITEGTAKLGPDSSKGADFNVSATAGTLTFAPGVTEQQITIDILGDPRFESAETVNIKLSTPTNATIADEDSVLTITDDDGAPQVTISDAAVIEGNSGTKTAVFTVNLSTISDVPVTIQFATADGTATAAGSLKDFVSTSGSLVFAAGETSKTIEVLVNGDNFFERDETFSVNLTLAQSESAKASIIDGTGTGTILNDTLDGKSVDTVTGVIISDAFTVEGSAAQFTISLTGPAPAGGITLKVNTRNGTAVSTSDYTALLGTSVTFAAGSLTSTVSVNTTNDTGFEATESFFLELDTAPTGVTAITREGRASIYNDDLRRIDSRTIQYIDEDGDLVTIRASKGTIPDSALTFSSVNSTVGGRVLQLLNIAGNNTLSGANISITAEPQVGFTAAPNGTQSNGRVDVGEIRAAIFSAALDLYVSGLDLGTVTVEGDLGRIVAGDDFVDRALGKLDVQSFGVRGNATLVSSDATGLRNTAEFQGPVGTIDVKGDFMGLVSVVGLEFGDIKNLKIGGALRGGSLGGSGVISFTGTLGNATIGSIIGGTTSTTGAILPVSDFGASIGTIRVLGDVQGSTSGSNAHTDTGKISAQKIGTVIIGGNLIGGTANAETSTDTGGSGVIVATAGIGSITINGAIRGGTSNSSGLIVAGSLGTLKVGEIIGSSGGNSGFVSISDTLGRVSIDGDLVGGAGEISGLIRARTINSLAIGDDIIGGTGSRSGGVETSGSLSRLDVAGEILGGTAGSSGYISVSQALGQANIAGNLTGGSGASSGSIKAASIGTIRFAKDVIGGTGTSSGAIESTSSISRVDILGELLGGGGNNSGAIIASGNIGQISITENVTGGDGTASGSIKGASISSVRIGVSLVGGAGADSGGINSSGTINNLDIAANIVGGTGATSGVANAVSLNKARIGNSIMGGSGTNSGALSGTGSVGQISVTENVIGGGGNGSGSINGGSMSSVKIGMDLTGGTGTESGVIRTSGVANQLTIDGDIVGGAGELSGSVRTGQINTLTVKNDIMGGSGSGSGGVFSSGLISRLDVSNDLVGGAGTLSGVIRAGTVSSIKVGSDIIGGSGSQSGGLEISGSLQKVEILGNLMGGTASISSGYLQAGSIGEVKIKGDVLANTMVMGLLGNASIRAATTISLIEVGGDVRGTETTSPIFSAGTRIAGVVINGNVEFADILSGYAGQLDSNNPRGVFTNPDATIGTVDVRGSVKGLNIVAGVAAGLDNRFATEDDFNVVPTTGTPEEPTDALSQIASVIFRSTIVTNTANFGIAAQHVVSVKLSNTAVALNPGAGNDTTPVPVAPGSLFQVRELAIPPV